MLPGRREECSLQREQHVQRPRGKEQKAELNLRVGRADLVSPGDTELSILKAVGSHGGRGFNLG